VRTFYCFHRRNGGELSCIVSRGTTLFEAMQWLYIRHPYVMPEELVAMVSGDEAREFVAMLRGVLADAVLGA